MSFYIILFLIMSMFNNWFTKFLEIEQLALPSLFGSGPPARHGISKEGGKGWMLGSQTLNNVIQGSTIVEVFSCPVVCNNWRSVSLMVFLGSLRKRAALNAFFSFSHQCLPPLLYFPS